MGRQVDSTVVHSSIALLQERFRQLERAKEMRHEKELLRMFSESKDARAATPYAPSRSFVSSDFMMIQPLEFNLYSGADILSMHMQVQAAETPKFDDSDVDTSLHL